MSNGRTTYHHSNGNCQKTTNYRDGCSERSVKNLSTGRVISHTKHRTTGQKNW